MPACSINKWFLILSLCLGGLSLSQAQVVPVHISNKGIYLFLDELGTSKVIDLHSLVKPYSRKYIAEKLMEADSSRAQLSKRQLKELDFYLRDFARDLPGAHTGEPATNWFWQKSLPNRRFDVFHYSDSLFRISVNPIIGSDIWVNSNGSFYHWWNGIEAWSTIGKFGFWASYRDNHESTPLTNPDFQNQRIGGAYFKGTGGGARDYDEFRGGITYNWKWGHVGIVMNQTSWGESNTGANILSGRTPAFAKIELSLQPADWFRFDYMHGWLHSEEIDSSQSFYLSSGYGITYREVYHSKFIASNIFTFIPWSGLQLSIGNSTIYDSPYPTAGFMIPTGFFRIVDHVANPGGVHDMNSMVFLSASARNLKHFHFFGSVFIDELSTERIFKDDEFNMVSFKIGFASTILSNTRICFEYTWTNPLTFRHFVPTTTYESNRYNLGHYLEDNAQDTYFALEYRPLRNLNIKSYFNYSFKGPDHTLLGTDRETVTPFESIVWESLRFGLIASYQIINDLNVRLGYEWRDVSGEQEYLQMWTPEVYHGQTGTFRFGINYGF